jgi:hypothetical protein
MGVEGVKEVEEVRMRGGRSVGAKQEHGIKRAR